MSSAPTPLLGWGAMLLVASLVTGRLRKRHLSPTRAGFQGGINGALPRVRHCVPSAREELGLSLGGGMRGVPRAGSGGRLPGKVLQS